MLIHLRLELRQKTILNSLQNKFIIRYVPKIYILRVVTGKKYLNWAEVLHTHFELVDI